MAVANRRLSRLRERLNFAYDRFVSRFGPLNAPPNQRAFHGDPDLPLLLSLEQYDEETKVAVKAAIFRERTIHHKQARSKRSAFPQGTALLVSLNEKGRVDLDHMAFLLGRPVDEFLRRLKGDGLPESADRALGNGRSSIFPAMSARNSARRRHCWCQ